MTKCYSMTLRATHPWVLALKLQPYELEDIVDRVEFCTNYADYDILNILYNEVVRRHIGYNLEYRLKAITIVEDEVTFHMLVGEGIDVYFR